MRSDPQARRTCHVLLQPWKWAGLIIADCSPADGSAYIKKHCDIDAQINEHSIGHAFVEAGKPWAIWARHSSDWPTIAHEAMHVVFGTLEYRGLRHSCESEEAYTYTVEGILRAVKEKWSI